MFLLHTACFFLLMKFYKSKIILINKQLVVNTLIVFNPNKWRNVITLSIDVINILHFFAKIVIKWKSAFFVLRLCPAYAFRSNNKFYLSQIKVSRLIKPLGKIVCRNGMFSFNWSVIKYRHPNRKAQVLRFSALQHWDKYYML